MFVILTVYLHFTASCIQKFTDTVKESLKNHDRFTSRRKIAFKNVMNKKCQFYWQFKER